MSADLYRQVGKLGTVTFWVTPAGVWQLEASESGSAALHPGDVAELAALLMAYATNPAMTAEESAQTRAKARQFAAVTLAAGRGRVQLVPGRNGGLSVPPGHYPVKRKDPS